MNTIYGGNWAPVFHYTYDASGNLTKRQDLRGGANDSLNAPSVQYDPLNRPVEWENTGAGDGPFARSWQQYDSLGRMTATWRDEQSGKGECFGYNPTGQLTGAAYNSDQVWTGNPQNVPRIVSYTYTPDTLNRSSVNENWGSIVTNYAPNALNQYQSIGGTIYNYDNNFNLREAPNWWGVFDAQSRLTAAGGGGNVVNFTYDGLGRCVRRVVHPPGGASRTLLFTYDGWKPVMEWDEAGNCQAWNIYGSGPDEILWRCQAGVGNLRYHHDVHGNVAFILGWSGEGLERYTYDAFGQPTITDWNGNVRSQSAYGNRFMFQGREYIPELAIYDYRHRMYHPGLGRFMQSDPTGFDAGDMNLFRYVGDDPVDRSDPTGLLDNSGLGPYSPLTSFGGGDWIKGSDGLSAWDWNHKNNQPAGVQLELIETGDRHIHRDEVIGKDGKRLSGLTDVTFTVYDSVPQPDGVSKVIGEMNANVYYADGPHSTAGPRTRSETARLEPQHMDRHFDPWFKRALQTVDVMNRNLHFGSHAEARNALESQLRRSFIETWAESHRMDKPVLKGGTGEHLLPFKYEE